VDAAGATSIMQRSVSTPPQATPRCPPCPSSIAGTVHTGRTGSVGRPFLTQPHERRDDGRFRNTPFAPPISAKEITESDWCRHDESHQAEALSTAPRDLTRKRVLPPPAGLTEREESPVQLRRRRARLRRVSVDFLRTDAGSFALTGQCNAS
jgi:hypothetical protein